MSWSAPIPVNNAAGDNPQRDTWPSLATDGLGRWVVVWESSSGNGPTGVDADIMASYSLNDGQSWSTPIAVNSWATIDTQGDYKPEIETDSAGRWIVVWRSNDSLGGRTGSDTDILVAHSTDVGASWSAAAPLYPYGETDNGSELSPGLATDGNGSWIVIYESDDPLGGSPEGNTDILASSSTLSCCGNGAVEAGEQCDDANLVDADGCSADCRAESSWQFMGTAEGGVVSLQVNGIEVSVPTVAGQSATLVAQNLSNAIQSEPLLFATGVTAFADDGNLILTAVLSEQFIDDAGL
jgi:cysteine-rich repeat protein